MINIKTRRLEIRNFVIDDWKDLQEIVIDKEASEYAIYDYQFPTAEDEVKGVTEWFTKDNSFLAVYELIDKKVIGYISLNGENTEEKDLGYCFSSAYQGKGYATESCIAIINYAFDMLDIKRITSGTANLNFPSCKLLNKLGFIKSGEGIVSFRKTPEGNPIEFAGASFLLEKENWIKNDDAKKASPT
jgi:[ribosomal protein S5]-alanine N-acetyltransferase